MDRNREARRGSTMAAAQSANGLSRRRHRTTNSLRDSPEEEAVEMAETAAGRLRDRGVSKKDRDRTRDRDREERERERERDRRSGKRIRRMVMREEGVGGGDDTSDESVNDEDEEDDDVDAVGGGSLRMLPPTNPPPVTMSTNSNSNFSNHNHNNHFLHRRSFPAPPSTAAVGGGGGGASKVRRPSFLKPADEMIGVSIPRKARSASTKRSHDWMSGGGIIGGGSELSHHQSSTSPARLTSAAASPSQPPAPASPSSSTVSVRKKIKSNGGNGSKPRPPKSSSKSSSSNPEELEIEIAEVLYGLMTQSQAAPSKREVGSNNESNKSSSDNKSRVSSPISNPCSSAAPPTAVAPKRKRPRQVTDNFSVRNSPVVDLHHQNQSPKAEVSSPNVAENVNNSGSVPENGLSFDFSNHHQAVEVGKCVENAVLAKEEVTSPKKSPAVVRPIENSTDVATTANKVTCSSEIKSQRVEIDLMAPPPQLRSSPEREADIIDFADNKRVGSHQGKEDDKDGKIVNGGGVVLNEVVEEKKKLETEGAEVAAAAASNNKSVVNQGRSIDLHLDLETSVTDRSHHQVVKKQQQPSAKSTRDDVNADKNAQSSSLPLPMSLPTWPGGLPPMGYVAPLQGVVSMDGNTMPSAPIQPLFTQPRPKRCATHCYIARNIHCLQQFMKMNPFWPAPAGSAPIFGAKPCNLNVLPAGELQGNIAGRSITSVQDKGPGLAMFPSHSGKDKVAQATSITDPAQRKQPILLQQALPSVAPANILHGPAFIFPFNQQQAAVAAASVRPASAKSTAGATSSLAGSSAATSATAGASAAAAAATAMSFNYPNMPSNETQYLAILQNNAYPFPMPAVGASPNYRGNPHPQAMPLFNGSFYPSQMIHPSQIPATSQPLQISQGHQNSSGSSSSQKQLQIQQQRQQGVAAIGGSGNLNNYPAPKSRSSQQTQQHNNTSQPRHLDSEMGGEDSPSTTADSRATRAAATMSVYGHNFAMPIHPQNFALMAPSGALAATIPNEKKQQQQHQQQQQSQQAQQQSSKRGVESIPPQTFAMSFSPINGSATTGIDLSSMAQNHAILQSLPESSRNSYHQIMAAAAVAHNAQQKKNFRISEESKIGGLDASTADEDRKVGGGLAGKGGQSIAFSRPDLTDLSGSSSTMPGSSVIDSSARNLNVATAGAARTSRSSITNSAGTPLQVQFQQQQQQQQQMLQIHNKQNHQQFAAALAARSKNPPTSNGSSYPDHLMTSASPAKFQNPLSSFPQSLVQTSNNSSSPNQSPQWKNTGRTPASQVPSSLASTTSSSVKGQPSHTQQPSRSLQQSHTQISFGVNQNQKPSSISQQTPSSNHQSPSPPMVVGSPTTSSISKGTSGSPRTNASTTTSNKNSQGQASSLSSQQLKNSQAVPSQRASPSILGNPHNSSSSGSAKVQQQKQTIQQSHLFFSNPYHQVQSQAQAQSQAHPQPQAQPQQQVHAHPQPQHSSSSTASAASGYYLQRRPTQQPQQHPGTATSSSGMLSLCPPVSLANATTTCDPAKAIAAAANSLKGSNLPSQGILHGAQFGSQASGNAHQLMPAGFSYVHAVPAAVQVKPAEQKQPAGNDNLNACSQPEKK